MPEKVKKNLLGRTVIKSGGYKSGGMSESRQSWKGGKNRDFDKTKTVTKKDDGGKVVTKSREVNRGFADNKAGSVRKKRVVTKSTDASGKKTREVRRFKSFIGPSGDVTTKTTKNNSGTNRSVTTNTQNGNNTFTKTNMGPVYQARAYNYQKKKLNK
jgi:hypothetical protein